MTSVLNEPQVEYGFIGKLTDLKYTYRPDIRNRYDLEQNFRKKFEALNRVNLTDAEFARLRDEITNPDVFQASKILRQRNTFKREDDSSLHYTLVNITDWCKNEFEVINQLRMNTAESNHRYDVILLINGVPVVQIELKTYEVSPRVAIKQIVDYKKDPGNGYTNSLLCFMQLFIASNHTNTYYFANNKNQHFSFNADEQYLPVYQWAAEDNKKITHLFDFADKFLSKCTLGEMISRYMVLVEGEQKLMVMRPYQIYAVKAIVECIHQNRGNGYIWHTTGSGKTLTSFKASTLLKDNPDIEKCLFVVDRKDLDRQTREEFNKFQEGCVEQNTNTEALVNKMLSNDYADKVIVTTIQKLGLALDPEHVKNYKDRLKPLSKKRVVFIFDECHRSQFGDNHKAIKEFFPHAQLFGFTGTPIFDKNSAYVKIEKNGETNEASYQTTEFIFQKELHAYTITNAIEDRNVLKFHVDYFKYGAKDKPEPDENEKPVIKKPLPKQVVVDAILQKHNAATNQRRFNAVLATASINDAIAYYHLFKDVQAQCAAMDESFVPLNIGCVFSPPVQVLAKETENQGNKNAADIKQLQEDLQQEKLDNETNPEEKKLALKTIFNDYNQQFGTNHRIGEFDLYYQDVQKRIKDHKFSNADYPHKNKLDLLIVVDMLLTGFDSKYLNTLYVDKNLKFHGLIQAFSRTNRILNEGKQYGNVLDFRGQQDAVNEAILLFCGANLGKAKEIWLVDAAPVQIAKYEEAIKALATFMETQKLPCRPEEVYSLKGDIANAGFINHFKEVQRIKNRLDQFTDLSTENKEKMEELLPNDQLRSFKAAYIEKVKRFKPGGPGGDTGGGGGGGANTGQGAPELDFELVLFANAIVDYDYIMELIAKATQTRPGKDKMTKEQIINLLGSTANLMEERDDLVAYIESLDFSKGRTVAEIREGFDDFKAEKHNKELATVATAHGLETEALKSFVDAIISRMIFDGEKLNDLLAPLQLGWKDRGKKEQALMADLIPQLKKLAQGRDISGLKAYE